MALLVLVVALLAGCGSDSDDGAATTTAAEATATAVDSTATPSLEGKITVSAAASLRDAFTAIAADVNETNPDLEIEFNFDSSSTLATQIIEGAPADVFASADEKNMTKLTEADKVDGDSTIFARNELVIVTKPGNPAGIESLADLATAAQDGVISLCGEDVPCGRYAAGALTAAGVTIPETSVTRGQNVTATLTALTEGDAVAAIVYATDALAAGDAVTTIKIPADHNVIASYPIAAVSGSEHADLANAFVEAVLSDAGQQILETYGFLLPQ
ncbi:MAG: molybdate ABC transporter substrate-binding protein [Microthrixaceae bacterium]|nr:molybdate ABC transporter substrate-binding protein [Microthrixaceae bacterium]